MHVLNKNKIIEIIISEFNHVQGIYLFGSFARDEATSTSDVGAHCVSQLKLGIPKTTREIFVLLTEANLISAELSKRLQSMVGFRNIAVRDYTKISMEIISAIIQSNLNDLREFAKIILQAKST